MRGVSEIGFNETPKRIPFGHPLGRCSFSENFMLITARALTFYLFSPSPVWPPEHAIRIVSSTSIEASALGFSG